MVRKTQYFCKGCTLCFGWASSCIVTPIDKDPVPSLFSVSFQFGWPAVLKWRSTLSASGLPTQSYQKLCLLSNCIMAVQQDSRASTITCLFYPGLWAGRR